MKILVMIPTYNEKVNIERMIPVLADEVFPKIKNHEMMILVADDGSPDGTRDVVENYKKHYKNLTLLEGKKEGLGKAYARAMQYGMNTLHADAVIEFDADFQHDPHDIPRLIKALDDGADYVIGSRYIPGGEIPKEWGFDRKIKSRLGGLFARCVFLMFNIHDITSGFKVTRSSFLKKVDLDHLYSYSFAYKIHILHDLVRLGAKVKEVPIIFYERTKGKSKIDTNDMTESFVVVLRLAWKDYQRVIKFLIIGGVGFFLQILLQESAVRIGVSHPTGVAIGAETAILSNFLFNNFWTFSDTAQIKERGNFFMRLVKFNVASLGSIIIQYVADFMAERIFGPTMHILSYSLPTRIVILFPTIILLVIPLNYIIYNKIIWKTQYLKDGKTS